MKNFSLKIMLMVTASLLLSTSAFAWNWTANKTVYYDNTNTKFTNVYLRIGRDNYASAYALSKVPGTANLYSYKMENKWENYGAFGITNNAGWTGDNQTVYKTCTGDGYQITNATAWFNDGHEGTDVSTDITIVAGTSHSTGTTEGVDKCTEFYSRTLTASKVQYTATITAPSNGTISVSYTDESGTAHNITSGSATVLPTCNLTITATPAVGYKLSSLMVGDTEISSGDVYAIRANKTITATFVESAPTLFLSHLPSVNNYEATLYGYLKYTGCQNISEYGFIYNTTESAISADTPTGTELKTTGSLSTQKSEFNVAGTFTNGTYFYRAFVKVSDTYFYSTKNDYGTFTINGSCDVSSVTAAIEDASAVLSAGSAGSTLTSETNATLYNWVCASQPDGAAAPVIATPASKSTTFTVSAAGEYTFKLQAKCADGDTWSESATVTFTACVAPTVQQLYLDERTANLLCQNETATATIVSQEGYDYTLYLGLKSYGTLAGNGATLTWRNVAGDGTFTVIATKGGTNLCATSMTPATQDEFDVDMTVTVDPGSAIAWQPALLSASGDMNQYPTWEIVGGGTNAYLLDTKTRFEYADGQSRQQVIFKGDAINNAATTYTVAVTAEKTVTVPVTKTCASTVNVEITVSPATEQCN